MKSADPTPAGAWPAVVLALGLALYAALAVSALLRTSCTFDEPIHLPPGYASLTLRDHRMNPDHPPLVRRIAALPLLFMDVRMETADHAWTTARPWEFGKRFLFRWNDAGRLLLAGRLMIVVLGASLGAAVFFWARRHFGLGAAAVSLLLFAVNPDMIAHGGVVTNDLGIALFTFLAIASFDLVTERVTWARLLLASLSFGAALGTKFSSVALVPIYVALGALVAFGPEPMAVDLRWLAPARRPGRGLARLAWVAAVLAVMALIGLAVLWASYGFSSPLAQDQAGEANFDWAALRPPPGPVTDILLLARRVHAVPEAYVWGFLHFLEHAESRPAFLLGERSEQGWWYYFPATIAMKTPLPLLALGLLSLLVIGSGRVGWRLRLFLLLPPAVFLGLTMTRSINIGHRHVLPVYPFLFVAAGSVAWLATAGGTVRLRRLWTGVTVAALAWAAVGTFRVHPHALAYFNELAGGPASGYRRLVDSNLDWGQDLPGLAAYQRREGIPKLKLAYFGTADPGYYGVVCDRLPGYQPPPPSTLVREVRPGDVVAVSATLLQGLYVEPAVEGLMARLRAEPPIATIGHSILVFRPSFEWRLE